MFWNSSNPIVPFLFAKCLKIFYGSKSFVGSATAFLIVSYTKATVFSPPGMPWRPAGKVKGPLFPRFG